MEELVPQNNDGNKKSLADNKNLVFWIGVISLIIGFVSAYFTFIYNKKVKLFYTVQSDIMLTDSYSFSKIKIYYDSTKVENVRAVTVSFWNSGNDFLHKDAISKVEPISIKSTKPVSILESRLIAVTRDNLKFVTTSYEDDIVGTPSDTTLDSYDYTGIEIEGDEGLEAGDGATYLILYTSKVACEWKVTARVKGIKEGFILKRNSNKDNGNEKTSGIVETEEVILAKNLLVTVVTSLFLFMNYSLIKKWNKEQFEDDPYNSLVIFAWVVMIFFFALIIYIWYDYFTSGILPNVLIN